jgi:uncharacterized protein
MRIAITGATGLIGRALAGALEARGDQVTRLVRGRHWDPTTGTVDPRAFEGADAVVHLAGESIAGLWTNAKRKRILESRVTGTRLIATALGGLQRPPAVLVSASAIGFYGDHPGNEPIDESASRGAGFLAEVVEAWERAADPARAAGVRVVHPRFGIVLSEKGGALAAMLPIYKLGIGGRVGSGDQIWSWVALDDVVQSVLACIDRKDLSGAVNVVAPQPVSNKAFVRTLGRVLRRPTLLPAPAFALKLVAGQMADEMLLFGARIVPRKLQGAGYEFRFRELESALRHILAAT